MNAAVDGADFKTVHLGPLLDGQTLPIVFNKTSVASVYVLICACSPDAVVF